MKSDIFKMELGYIKNPDYRESAITMLELLPDYFYEIPASTTGKYHPKFALGDGGLVRHTKVAVRIGYELCQNNSIGNVFTDAEKDLIVIALMLHDGTKTGLNGSEYTAFDHPLIVCEYIKTNKDKLKFTDSEIELICSMISSHMGEWNTSKYSNVVLPLPINKYQKFVHMADFLASRKFLDVEFEDDDIVISG